jgi:hypothetical protein
MKYLVVVAFFVLCSPAFADQIEVSFGPIPATEYNFLPGPPVSGTLLLTIGLPQYTGDWAMFGPQDPVLGGTGEVDGLVVLSIVGGFVNDSGDYPSPGSTMLLNMSDGSQESFVSTFGPFWFHELVRGGVESEFDIISVQVLSNEPPPVATPEPGTLLLTLTGLLFFAAVWKRC